MDNKKYLKGDCGKFCEYLSLIISKELDYLVINSKFSNSFSRKIKKIVDDIKNSGKKDIELSIMFNSQDEISLIDSMILGEFISDNFIVCIDKYKNIDLDNIFKITKEKDEKIQREFVMTSFLILYNTIKSMYKEIQCNYDIVDQYNEGYSLDENNNLKNIVIVLVLRIMEDICEYLRIEKEYIKNSIKDIIDNKKM